MGNFSAIGPMTAAATARSTPAAAAPVTPQAANAPARPDQYSANFYGQYANPIPLEYMCDYPGAADRLKAFGISDSQKLLAWGKTPTGRWAMSHMIAMFASGQERAAIDAKIREWTGRADLARVGADNRLGALLFRAGVYDAWQLTAYRDPFSQFELYTKLNLDALQLGMQAMDYGRLRSTISHALSAPPLVRW